MLKEFDGHSFPPHRLIATHPIELGGKIVRVKFEVVDVPIYYNFFLEFSNIDSMMVLVSLFF